MQKKAHCMYIRGLDFFADHKTVWTLRFPYVMVSCPPIRSLHTNILRAHGKLLKYKESGISMVQTVHMVRYLSLIIYPPRYGMQP